MNINPLSNNNNYFSKDLTGSTSESKGKSENPKVQDKLELSEEAKKIQSSKTNGKDLNAIKAKIASNFYNSNEVLNKVADKILKALG